MRGGIIIPIILVLIYLGAFAEKNAFEDMVIVLFFGALGWVMEKLEWPRPPVLLGLVLGPLAENRLFLSTDNYGLAWMHRPGVIAIFALTLVGIFYPIIKSAARSETEIVQRNHGTNNFGSRQPMPAGGSAPRLLGLPLVVIATARAGALAKPQFWFSRRPISVGHRHSDADSRFRQLGRDLYGQKKKKELAIRRNS